MQKETLPMKSDSSCKGQILLLRFEELEMGVERESIIEAVLLLTANSIRGLASIFSI